MAPRWQRLEGFVLVLRSAAAVTIETGIVWESAVMGDDKARVSGPVIPRVTVRRHSSRRRPKDMRMFIPAIAAISRSNRTGTDQQVVSGTASRAGTGRLMRPRQTLNQQDLRLTKPSAQPEHAPPRSSLPGPEWQDRLQGRLGPICSFADAAAGPVEGLVLKAAREVQQPGPDPALG